MNRKKIRPQDGNRHVRTQLKNSFFIFLSRSTPLDEVLKNPLLKVREKQIELLRWGVVRGIKVSIFS